MIKKHNSRRVLKNGDDNTNCYFDLFDDLISRFGDIILCDDPKIVFNVGILCHPMIDTDHTKDKSSDNMSGNANYYKLSEELIKRGATISSPIYTPHCMNSAEKTFTLSPSGDIYKCVTGIENKRFLLSTYDEFMHNPAILIRDNIYQIERSHRAPCLNCEYLAMCNGGCKCQHYEKNDVLCRKGLIDREMELLLHLLYHGCFTEEGLFQKRSDGLQ